MPCSPQTACRNVTATRPRTPRARSASRRSPELVRSAVDGLILTPSLARLRSRTRRHVSHCRTAACATHLLTLIAVGWVVSEGGRAGAAGVGCDPVRQTVTNISLFNRTWIVLVWRGARGAAKRRLDTPVPVPDGAQHDDRSKSPRRLPERAPRHGDGRDGDGRQQFLRRPRSLRGTDRHAEAVGIARGLPSNVQAKASTLHASDAPSNRARPSTAKADTR